MFQCRLRRGRKQEARKAGGEREPIQKLAHVVVLHLSLISSFSVCKTGGTCHDAVEPGGEQAAPIFAHAPPRRGDVRHAGGLGTLQSKTGRGRVLFFIFNVSKTFEFQV